MEATTKLLEASPNDTSETQFRSKSEAEEWSYDQGYDANIDEFWKIAPNDIVREIGMLFIKEGKDEARAAMYEEIRQCIDVSINEHLNPWIDGQMRLYAGYDVAENGDTLEEGDFGTWEDLRVHFSAGIRDRLCDDERYISI